MRKITSIELSNINLILEKFKVNPIQENCEIILNKLDSQNINFNDDYFMGKCVNFQKIKEDILTNWLFKRDYSIKEIMSFMDRTKDASSIQITPDDLNSLKENFLDHLFGKLREYCQIEIKDLNIEFYIKIKLDIQE